MASLNNFFNPDKDKLLQETEEAAAVEQTMPEGPDMGDVITSSYANSYMHTIGVGGIASSWDYITNGLNAPKYTAEQLSEIYPDIPSEVFKGGARAYQGEFLVDKYKKQEEARQIQEFVQGVADPNASIFSTIGREAVPFTAGLLGSFADLANLPVAAAGSALLSGATKVAAPLLSRMAPSAYTTVMNTVANSRFLSNIAPEITSNLAADVAISYPTQNYLLSDYTKDKADLEDVVIQSLGSAIFFGVGKGIFKGKNLDFGRNSWNAVQDSLNTHVVNNADLHSIHTGSDVHKTAMLQLAVADTVVNGHAGRQSIREVMAERAFTGASNDIPDQGFFSLVEKGSGNTEYLGNRYGDNFVFTDSPGAIKGMADVYSVESPRDFDVYKLNTDKYNIADLEQLNSQEYPELLDELENQFGSSAVSGLDNTSTVKDIYDMVANSRITPDNTGADIAAFYDRANAILKEKGFDGIVHTNNIGDAHKVVEIFQDRMNPDDLAQQGSITGKTVESPISENVDVRNTDIVTDAGVIKTVEEVPYDPYYNDDASHIMNQESVNSDSYLREYKDYGLDKIDEKILYDEEPTEELKVAQEKYTADHPDKQEEIVKAMENCLRKNK